MSQRARASLTINRLLVVSVVLVSAGLFIPIIAPPPENEPQPQPHGQPQDQEQEPGVNHSLIYFTHFADHAVFESQPSDACHTIRCKGAAGFKCYQCLLQQGLVIHIETSHNFIPLLCMSSYNLTAAEQGTKDNMMFSGMNYIVNIYRRSESKGRIISAWPFRLWPRRIANEPRKTSLLFSLEGGGPAPFNPPA